MNTLAWTQFRIAYPYARPSSEFKHAIVELSPSDITGYNQIEYKDERYSLPKEEKAISILNTLKNKGCYGFLKQSGEGREIIDYRQKQITAMGHSMQMALTLAPLANYQSEFDRENAPLILFSAAIILPRGAPEFCGARITTYCSPDQALKPLLDKYEAAQIFSASALILPMRDALILQKGLKKQNQSVKLEPIATLNHKQNDTKNVSIIGVEEDELPKLASYLGINRYYYESKQSLKFKFQTKYIISTVIIIISILIFGLLSLVSTGEEIITDEYLKRKHYLISTIYNDNYKGKKSRIRDEAIKEYILREKGQGFYSRRQNSTDRIDLKEVDLFQTDLHNFQLDHINFLNSSLKKGNFNRASFKGSYLKFVDFSEAFLYKSDLSYSVIARVNFSQANLRGANLEHSIGIQTANLSSALFDEETLWPSGFSRKDAEEMGAIFAPIKKDEVFINPLSK